VELDPTDQAAKHLLNALTGETSDNAPKQYVQCLFDRYAIKFDHQVLTKLDYKVPDLLHKVLGAFAKRGCQFQNALDLGCGTGLAGLEIRFIAERLSGVDISPKMIEEAQKKSVYDQLVIGDIVEFLKHTNEKYDLIVAADVFIYLGNLEPVFEALCNCLLPDTYFIFNTENAAQQKYILQKSGRFAHSQVYIQDLTKAFGFLIEYCKSIGIRKENNKWIKGEIYILNYK
jgi:predicted TPR repeat methyltransferase